MGNFNLDLGIAISGSCLQSDLVSHDLVSSYLKGYQSIIAEKLFSTDLVKALISLGLLSISLWRIERFTIGKIDPTKKLFYRELLSRLEKL